MRISPLVFVVAVLLVSVAAGQSTAAAIDHLTPWVTPIVAAPTSAIHASQSATFE